jgi:hypothetical protein
MASTVPQNYEQVGYGAPSGAQIRGYNRAIIGGGVATRTLLPAESGALCQFDLAAGVVYTLPTPVIGMQFEFATTVTITSNAAKVITNAATVFILGDLQMILVGAATTLAVAGNGSTHIAISSNGTTTGGVIGDRYTLTAISATQWLVTGFVSGTGSLATPFATS